MNYQFGEIVNRNLIQQHLTDLQQFDLNELKSETQKKAFWINIYNGMTNYVIIERQIQQSMKEAEGIFRQKIFSIGAMEFSLDDVEHGILRRNQRAMFSASDPRLALQVDDLDYRIHFALNCGAQSCPMIAFYTTAQIEEELAIAERSFIEQEFLVDIDKKRINCSPLFEWYRADFGKRFLDDSAYADFEVRLREYDWSI
ncbi:MAG: DUF547 domain-containing protein [Saprospiraceae bacterium]